jgi:xanthine dehydrogenase accessory factor
MGHAGDKISTITCPIGNPNLGKHPAAIAIGVAAAMITATTPRG